MSSALSADPVSLAILAPFRTLRQPTHHRELAHLLLGRGRGSPDPAFARRNVMHQAGGGGKLCAGSDRQMVGNSGAAADLDKVAERDRAGQPGIAGDEAAATNPRVVS